MQWLEEQLRCERAFNEDLKARLHDMEAQKEANMSSDDKSCDCDLKPVNDSSQQIVVCHFLRSLVTVRNIDSYPAFRQALKSTPQLHGANRLFL